MTAPISGGTTRSLHAPWRKKPAPESPEPAADSKLLAEILEHSPIAKRLANPSSISEAEPSYVLQKDLFSDCNCRGLLWLHNEPYS